MEEQNNKLLYNDLLFSNILKNNIEKAKIQKKIKKLKIQKKIIQKETGLRITPIKNKPQIINDFFKVLDYSDLPIYFDEVNKVWWRYHSELYGIYYSRENRDFFIGATMYLKNNKDFFFSFFFNVFKNKVNFLKQKINCFYLYKHTINKIQSNFKNDQIIKNFDLPKINQLNTRGKQYLFPYVWKNYSMRSFGTLNNELDLYVSSYNANWNKINNSDNLFGIKVRMGKNYLMPVHSTLYSFDVLLQLYENKRLGYSAKILKWKRWQLWNRLKKIFIKFKFKFDKNFYIKLLNTYFCVLLNKFNKNINLFNNLIFFKINKFNIYKFIYFKILNKFININYTYDIKYNMFISKKNLIKKFFFIKFFYKCNYNYLLNLNTKSINYYFYKYNNFYKNMKNLINIKLYRSLNKFLKKNKIQINKNKIVWQDYQYLKLPKKKNNKFNIILDKVTELCQHYLNKWKKLLDLKKKNKNITKKYIIYNNIFFCNKFDISSWRKRNGKSLFKCIWVTRQLKRPKIKWIYYKKGKKQRKSKKLKRWLKNTSLLLKYKYILRIKDKAMFDNIKKLYPLILINLKTNFGFYLASLYILKMELTKNNFQINLIDCNRKINLYLNFLTFFYYYNDSDSIWKQTFTAKKNKTNILFYKRYLMELNI